MKRSTWLRKGLPFLLFGITDGSAVTPSPAPAPHSVGGGYPPDWLEEAEWRYRSVGTIMVSGHTRVPSDRDEPVPARKDRSVGVLDRVRYACSAASAEWHSRSLARPAATGASSGSVARQDTSAGSSAVRHAVACHCGEARVSRCAARPPNNDAAMLLLGGQR